MHYPNIIPVLFLIAAAILFVSLVTNLVQFLKNQGHKKTNKRLAERVIYLEDEEKRKKDQYDRKNEINYPIGSKVIVRSNESEKLWHGEVVDFEKVGPTSIPIVVETGKKMKWVVFGVVAHYSDARWKALRKLKPSEQWLAMTRHHV